MDDFYPFFLVFAQNHPFLTWCALWNLWAIYWLAKVLIGLASRTMRFIVVLFRGWPPAHLDADGDWKPAAKVEEAATGKVVAHTGFNKRPTTRHPRPGDPDFIPSIDGY